MNSSATYRLPPWRRASQVFSSLSQQERDWGLRQFRIPDVWVNTRGAGVRIAVLDTGVDAQHVDLQGQICAMRDFTNSHCGIFDVQGHGTHCAGTIAARENEQGIVGVCPEIGDGGGLIIGKVLGDDGVGEPSWGAEGVDWAVSEGADVISMSLGSPEPDERMHEAILRAAELGVPTISAAGNDGQRGDARDSVNYPARYAETIAVGAVGRDRLISEFSSRGAAIDVAAPGEDILSCIPGNRWTRMSGTSMATPFVAAIVGLALSDGDRPSVSAIRQALRDHAEDAGTPGHDSSYGAGLIRPAPFVNAVRNDRDGDRDGIWVWIPRGYVSDEIQRNACSGNAG